MSQPKVGERGYQLAVVQTTRGCSTRSSHAKGTQDPGRAARSPSGRDLASMRVLDVGASAGIIVGELGRVFGEVVGIDIDEGGIERGRRFLTGPNQELRVGDAMNIPYGDETFDVVVLNHVYEHIPDAGRAFDEVWRILRPGGVYVASPNRLAAIEPHHKLRAVLPGSRTRCRPLPPCGRQG